MPTYDYECDACGHAFELFQQISADPETKCPKCKKKKLRRLFGTGAALMFKGSGFYQTDYRSDSYKKASDADKKSSSAEPSTSEKSEAKTESKAEAKSEPKPETKPSSSGKNKKADS